MADDSSSPSSEFQAAYAILLLQLKIYISSMFAIFVWEYILTFRSELTHMWPARISIVKICFFINRYATFVFLILIMVTSFAPISINQCSRLHHTQVTILPTLIYYGTFVTDISTLYPYHPELHSCTLSTNSKPTRKIYIWFSYLKLHLQIVIVFVCNVKLSHRCSALFRQPQPVYLGLIGLSLVQVAVQCWACAKNERMPCKPSNNASPSFYGPATYFMSFCQRPNAAASLPPGVVGCFSSPSAANRPYALAGWIFPLLTNFV